MLSQLAGSDAAHLSGSEPPVQGFRMVDVETVHDKHNLLRIWIGTIHEVPQHIGNITRCPWRPDPEATESAQRLHDQEEDTGAMPFTLKVFPKRLDRLDRQLPSRDRAQHPRSPVEIDLRSPRLIDALVNVLNVVRFGREARQRLANPLLSRAWARLSFNRVVRRKMTDRLRQFQVNQLVRQQAQRPVPIPFWWIATGHGNEIGCYLAGDLRLGARSGFVMKNAVQTSSDVALLQMGHRPLALPGRLDNRLNRAFLSLASTLRQQGPGTPSNTRRNGCLTFTVVLVPFLRFRTGECVYVCPSQKYAMQCPTIICYDQSNQALAIRGPDEVDFVARIRSENDPLTAD